MRVRITTSRLTLTAAKRIYRWNGERWEGVYRNPTSGRWNKCRNYGLLLGQRSKFEDPSF